MQQVIQQAKQESNTISKIMSSRKRREAEIIETPKVVVD
jgi:chaperonin cofactor prefoldin